MSPKQRALITARDRAVLEFLSEHRTVVGTQTAALLGVSERAALQRLQKLGDSGLVEVNRIFAGLSPAVRITRAGLRALSRNLPEPRLNLEQYRHDVGTGWLWLAARDGAFGPLDRIISEREMRSHDARPGNEASAHGVSVWRPARRGPGSDRHYPDLQLQTSSGHRIAVELELSGKSDKRLDQIMFGYSIDRGYDRVLYLVSDRQLGERIARAARRAGVSEMVRVQQLAPEGIADAPRAASFQRSRPAPARTTVLRSRSAAGGKSVERQPQVSR